MDVVIDGKQLAMELDTGAAVSIIYDEKSLFPDLKLLPSTIILKTYTEESMEVVGQLNVRVKYGDQEAKLVLVVVRGNGPSLLGRNWLKYLRLDWPRIASVRAVHSQALSTLMQQHQPLFTDGRVVRSDAASVARSSSSIFQTPSSAVRNQRRHR